MPTIECRTGRDSLANGHRIWHEVFIALDDSGVHGYRAREGQIRRVEERACTMSLIVHPVTYYCTYIGICECVHVIRMHAQWFPSNGFDEPRANIGAQCMHARVYYSRCI